LPPDSRILGALAGLALSAALAGETPAKPRKCAVTEAQLLGAWQSVSGGFFQEMEFALDAGKGVFNSWLHQRPEILGGRWRVEACTLFIEASNSDGLRFELQLVRRRGDRLYLREPDGQGDWVYKRVKP
jgi:hypothetical protein